MKGGLALGQSLPKVGVHRGELPLHRALSLDDSLQGYMGREDGGY